MQFNIYYVVFIFVVSLSCNGSYNENRNNDLKTILDYHANKLINPKIRILKKNNLVAIATSDSLIKNNDSEAILMGNVKSDFFEENNLMSTLFSDSGVIRNNSDRMEAFGNVMLIGKDSVILYSNKLIWDNQYKIVFSDDSVMFKNQDNDTLYGVGFESDINLSNWKIFNPIGVTHNNE
tara:strand:- start:37 stop:573 length:537 start_codon:yes stop_codon:yes gene_type:complete